MMENLTETLGWDVNPLLRMQIAVANACCIAIYECVAIVTCIRNHSLCDSVGGVSHAISNNRGTSSGALHP